MNIKNDRWLFFSNDEWYQCWSQSMTSANIKTISINEPTIIRLPCGETIHCSIIFIPPTQCTNTTLLIKAINNTDAEQNLISPIKLKTITKRLLSIYEIAARNVFMQLESAIQTSTFSFKNLSPNFLSLIAATISLILFGILLLIFKCLKINIQKQVN